MQRDTIIKVHTDKDNRKGRALNTSIGVIQVDEKGFAEVSAENADSLVRAGTGFEIVDMPDDKFLENKKKVALQKFREKTAKAIETEEQQHANLQSQLEEKEKTILQLKGRIQELEEKEILSEELISEQSSKIDSLQKALDSINVDEEVEEDIDEDIEEEIEEDEEDIEEEESPAFSKKNLEKLKVVDLQELAKDFPEEEWGELLKKDLITYLLDKLNG